MTFREIPSVEKHLGGGFQIKISEDGMKESEISEIRKNFARVEAKQCKDAFNLALGDLNIALDELNTRCTALERAALWEEEHRQEMEDRELIYWTGPLNDLSRAVKNLQTHRKRFMTKARDCLALPGLTHSSLFSDTYEKMGIEILNLLNTIRLFSQAALYEEEGDRNPDVRWSDGFRIIITALKRLEGLVGAADPMYWDEMNHSGESKANHG